MTARNLLISVVVVSAGIARAQVGGDLTPPGAPGKTMKTLDQVEARVPLVEGAAGVTIAPSGSITISQPGSYYLTDNLSVSEDGILITSSDVRVDLNGFQVSGSDTVATREGIVATGTALDPLFNLAVTNGSIAGFGNFVEFEHVRNSQLSRLRAAGCGDSGIRISGESDGNTISECLLTETGQYGIFLYGDGGHCNGNTIRDCSVSETGSYGINLYSNTGECSGNVIIDCAILNSGSDGVALNGSGTGKCSGNTVRGCSIQHAGRHGVATGANPGNSEGNRVIGCAITDSQGQGINTFIGGGGTITGLEIRNNTIIGAVDRGVSLAGSGVAAGRVEGNHVSGVTSGATSYGFYVSGGSGCLVVKNTSVGQDDNFFIGATHASGPEVTAAGVLANTGDPSHPWANFSLDEGP